MTSDFASLIEMEDECSPTLIEDVSVFDGKQNDLIEHQDVLIQDGKIADIGPSGTIPVSSMKKIEAHGMVLMPGLELACTPIRKRCYSLEKN